MGLRGRWKPKDGFAPFFALIMSIDSLLQICDKIREVCLLSLV